MPRIGAGPPRTSYVGGHLDIASPTAFIPLPAIAAVPNRSAPWVMFGVRRSVARAGPTTNSPTGSAASGLIMFSTRTGAFARCISGHVSSASRGT